MCSCLCCTAGLIAAQVRAQQKLLSARPGSLVFQLDSNPVWEDEHKVGVDVTLEYRELYNRYIHIP